MKKYMVLIVIMVLSVWGCASPEGNGTVELDGPILESFDREGNLEFNGAVINVGDEAVSSLYVVIVLKDENGNVIEANSVSVFGDDPTALLYPSERVFFSLSVASDPSRVFSREVEIYYEDGTDVSPSS
ncbi:MAG: FxLYD domain-containing protein [Deltaproteobacteria bacterium]